MIDVVGNMVLSAERKQEQLVLTGTVDGSDRGVEGFRMQTLKNKKRN